LLEQKLEDIVLRDKPLTEEELQKFPEMSDDQQQKLIERAKASLMKARFRSGEDIEELSEQRLKQLSDPIEIMEKQREQ
jgi:uncharacterized protein YoaH (UPF0181 family)